MTMSQQPDTPTPAADDAADTSPESPLDALTRELALAQQQAQDAKDAQLRTMAEFENSRRRLERDAQSSLKYANEKLIGELLAVIDSLELGMQAAVGAEGPAKAMADGMQLTWRQLMSVLEKGGVQAINPIGDAFNPELHQAMTMAESADLPPNHVLNVMQKGYRLHERLLRPAMVVVSKAPAAAP